MTTEEIVKKANSSPALKMQQKAQYPSRYKGKIPFKIKCLKTVVSDLWFLSEHSDLLCESKKEYHVWVNANGYTSAILPTGKLVQLKPDEFEVIEWHETKK